MTQRIIQVDAFTDTPFAGNPAAVCILSEPPSEAWMQNVAREMNLSETAFLLRDEESGDSEFQLRWFTPTTEVELCGHATLASAHVLWEDGHLAPDAPARFQTRSGLLTAERKGEWIEMDFPAEPPEETEIPAEIERALGLDPLYVGRNRFDLLVEVEDEKAVRILRPDLGLLRQIHARGIIVTSRATSGSFDFVSRFFAPRAGVDEDPVTGSAHCALGPFWSERLDRHELTGYQVSARGGVVRVRPEGDRVKLGGQAVTVLRGELL